MGLILRNTKSARLVQVCRKFLNISWDVGQYPVVRKRGREGRGRAGDVGYNAKISSCKVPTSGVKARGKKS